MYGGVMKTNARQAAIGDVRRDESSGEEDADDDDGRYKENAVKAVKILGGSALTLLVASGLGATGYALLNPPEPPPIFAEGALLTDTEINCGDAVSRYEPDDEGDEAIAGGGPAIFPGPGWAGGLNYYYRHEDALVVAACNAYLKQNPDVPEGRLFTAEASSERFNDGTDKVRFYIIVTETDKVADAG